MTQPLSILNTRGQSTDTLWGADGVSKIKLAIGDVSAGLTPHAAYQGVATHLHGDAFDSGSGQVGVVAVAGVDSGPNVRKLLVDSNGKLLFGQIADDTAWVAAGYVLPVGFVADEAATDSVDEGDVGAARMTLDRKQITAPYAHAAGGATPYQLISAGTTNATSVKASAGKVYSIAVSNSNAAVRYLKLYDKATAPTVGTDTPVHTVMIPAGGTAVVPFPVGIAFAAGIALAMTTGVAVADTGAVSASEHVVNLSYA